MGSGEIKMNDSTRDPQDMRYAAGYVDPNALYMNMSQPHGYYTPNSNGLSAIYHNQAGDLHTPTMGLSMMTPLSLSQQMPGPGMSADGHNMAMDHFNPSFMSQPFQNAQPFPQQSSFPPGTFVQDSGYDAVEEQVDELSLNDVDMQGNTQMMSLQHPDQVAAHTPGEKYVLSRSLTDEYSLTFLLPLF